KRYTRQGMTFIPVLEYLQFFYLILLQIFLLENYDIRPGEIHVKLNLARWLIYASEELCRILKMMDLIKDLRKLRFRIKNGVKEELLPLLKLEGIGRVRARKLFANNIKDVGAIKKANITILVHLLGKKMAISVKEQVGIKLKKEDIQIKPTKRKGQMSLGKY
ncbi:hypothetical protein ACFL1H_05220, partial [Nanoarchaeota archaeon]